MTRYALLMTVLLFAFIPAHAEVPAPLAPYITADEFRAAGLHRLTPEELERFERWFLRTVGAETATVPDSAPDTEHPGLFGFGSLAARTPEIEATLDGTFTGWTRGTRFQLDNGQVWEVVAGAGFRPVRPVERPGVTIRRMAFGSFMLRVEGYNASVRVRRVE